MKTKTLMTLVLFLSISYVANSAEKSFPVLTDTLKKTGQYLLFSKTANIEDATIIKNKKSKDQILYIKIGFTKAESNSNAVKTAVLQGNKQYQEANNPTISEVKILKGKYEDMKAEAVTKTSTLYTLTGLEFPLRLSIMFMGETLDFELLESGKWDVDLILKK